MKNFNFGFISALIVLTLIAFTCQKEESVITPPTKGVIKGNVIDNNTNQPIENAVIYTDPGSVQVFTDEYGDYRMLNVEPGSYTVFCYTTGYDTLSAKVSVTAGVETEANFKLTKQDTSTTGSKKYGSVAGIVKDYNNEQPLDNVTIKTSPATSVTTTNTSGIYTLSNILPGDYTLIAKKKDYDSTTVAIKVVAGVETQANINLILTSTLDTTLLGKVRGRVTDLVSATPIPNANVYTDPATSTVTTDANGNYFINYITPGTYKIIAEKNEYLSDTTTVEIKKNLETVANLTLRALSGTLGNIKGKVKDEITELPLNNVNVYTVPSTSSVSTDSQGDYIINNISPGTYKVIASKNEYFSDTTEVVVKSELDAIANLFLKKSTGSIEGTVIFEAAGTPVNNARVRTIPATVVQLTDNNGKFLFEKLDPGSYKIITEKVDHISDTTDVVVKAGEKMSVTILLKSSL